MNRHPVTLANLIDWVDGRLDEERQCEVEAHLATSCPACLRDLAWMQRVIEAARTDNTVEPPARCVAQAKALYRSRLLRPAPAAPRLRPFGLPRLAWGVAMLLLVVGVTLALAQLPTLFLREATLAALDGTVEARGVGEAQWQALARGARLAEGEQLRVVDGVAVLALFDGSILQMQPGTALTLSSLRSGLFGGARRIALNQQAGSVDYDVAPLSGILSSFEAQSPTVRVTVRGTRFVIAVESMVETRVTVLQGSVWLVNPVQSTVLVEREVAIVPADAPLIRLPTLMPTPTPVPTVAEAAIPTGPLATTVPPTAWVEPTQMLQPTQTLVPRTTSIPGATRSVTPIMRVTATLPVTVRLAPSATMLPEKAEFKGIIERFPPGLLGIWQVGGRQVWVTRRTRITGRPALGLQAMVTYLVSSPSELVQALPVALRIKVERPRPGQTLGPSATPWWGASLTHTPQPAVTARPSRTPQPVRTPSPTHTRPVVQTASPMLTSRPTHTPSATASPHAVETARPSRTPRPTRTPPPTRTAQSAELPQLTRTPEPAVTQPPVATPGPQIIRFSGVIQRLPALRLGPWVIDGRTVAVTPDTQIEGMPVFGLRVEVQAVRRTNTVLQAIKIFVYNPP